MALIASIGAAWALALFLVPARAQPSLSCAVAEDALACHESSDGFSVLQTRVQRPKLQLVGEHATSAKTLACRNFPNQVAYNRLIASVAVRAIDCAREASAAKHACPEFPAPPLARLRSNLAARQAVPPSVLQTGHTAARGKFTASEGSPAEVAVVSVCYSDTPGWDNVCSVAKKNFQQYSQHHGYQLFFYDHPVNDTAGRPATWHKVRAIQEVMGKKGVEFVFWMDADSLFMNTTKPLNDALPSGNNQKSIVGDMNCFLNYGHFAMRNSDWSNNFLRNLWGVYPPPEPWFEQSAAVYLLVGRRQDCSDTVVENGCCSAGALVMPQVEVKEQRVMNSYTNTFHEGDLLVHFAGARTEDKVALMEEYAAKAGSPGLADFHAALLQAVWSSGLESVSGCFA